MEAASLLSDKLQGRCCITGGGPAGMMLAYLLARAAIDVLVLEKSTLIVGGKIVFQR
jgi:flavin-dependent dehydrogenase